jgi:hypothetical protein
MPRDSMEGMKAYLPLPGDVKIDVVSLLVLHGGGVGGFTKGEKTRETRLRRRSRARSERGALV